MIERLNLYEWNQFKDINIKFHPRITIITGANGSGKSTILRVVGSLIGWDYPEIGVPTDYENSLFMSGIKKEKLIEQIENKSFLNSDFNDYGIKIGSVNLDSENGYDIFVPNKVDKASYSISLKPFNSTAKEPGNLRGLNISSHRFAFSYTKLEHIPTNIISKEQAFTKYTESLKKRIIPVSYYNPQEENPTLHMKSTLISLAVFAQGNEFVKKNEDSYKLFIGFIEVLKTLLPESLGFYNINIQNGEIVLLTHSGEFLLDSVSGGIGALIDLAWQLYMYDEDGEFVVSIDEIENHLHPAMQRNILPNLLKAFPKVQFIVTTHSPFIISSVKDSKIYALKYTDSNKIQSYELDLETKAISAMEVLREVLGVPVTLPVWIEERIENIIKKYRDIELNAQTYLNLKNELQDVGLGDQMPQALGLLQEGRKNEETKKDRKTRYSCE